MHFLASTYANLGKWDAAEHMFDTILTRKRKMDGKYVLAKDPTTWTTLIHLLIVYAHQGRWDEVKNTLEIIVDAWKITGPSFPGWRPNILIIMAYLEIACAHMELWDKAEEYGRKAKGKSEDSVYAPPAAAQRNRQAIFGASQNSQELPEDFRNALKKDSTKDTARTIESIPLDELKELKERLVELSKGTTGALRRTRTRSLAQGKKPKKLSLKRQVHSRKAGKYRADRELGKPGRWQVIWNVIRELIRNFHMTTLYIHDVIVYRIKQAQKDILYQTI